MREVLEKHPLAAHPEPKKGTEITTSIKKTKNPSTVSVTATSSATPATTGDPPDNPTSESATTTTSGAPVGVLLSSLAPPSVTYPATPQGFSPAKLVDYRGTHPKQGQLTALPGALAELSANAASYTKVFEPIGPPIAQLTEDLTNAGGWSSLRVATEQFLLYVKSYEAITWKTAMADIATLNTLFKLLSEQNLQLAQQFPELLKLLEVPSMIGKRGASTRSKKAKAKAATTTTATPHPAATPAAPTNGGTAH